MRKNYFLVILAILLTGNGIAQNMPSYVPKDGLVAYYSFDNNLNDVVNGYTLSTSDASYQNGVKNNSFVFNGSQECYSTDLNFRRIFDNTNNWSVNFWFNSSIPYNQIQSIPTGYSNTEKMLFACDGENYYPYKRLWIQSRENKIWICRDGFDASASSYTDDFLKENTWYFVSVNYDGTGYKIYVDGKEKNLTQSGNLTLDLGNTDTHTEQVTIGGNRQNNVAEWKGSMDEVMVYNRVLSPNEVSALFKGNNIASTIPSHIPSEGLVGYWPFNGNANDESGNGNHGTVNGATLSSDRSGKANSAYSFDGQDGVKITVEDAITLRPQNYTLNAWVFITGSTMWNQILSKRIANNNTNSYGIMESGSNFGAEAPSETYDLVSNINGNQKGTTNTNPIKLGTWNMLTGSFDGIAMKFYVNGQLTSNNNFNGNIQYTSDPLYFGTSGYFSGQNFNGKLDDIAIYNRALTEQEITSLYTENNPCTSVPTIKAEGPTTFVEGDTLMLITNNGAGHTFQWQKDSVAIAGATDSIYKVTTSGNYTVTVTEQVGLCKETSKGVLVTVTPKITPTIPSYIPTNGLVGYWPFNGNANDESGNGHNGIVNGATLTTDRNGNGSSSYQFQPENQFITFPTTKDINLANLNGLTISFWYKASLSGNMRMIHFFDETNDLSIHYSSYGEMHCINYVNQIGPKFNHKLQPPMNKWTNIIWTLDFNNKISSIYFDGKLVNVLNPEDIIVSNSMYMRVSEPNWQYNGSLDDIAIYNRALTEQEITALYTGCTSETATSSNFNSLLLSTGSSVSLSAEPKGGVFKGASIDSNKFVPSKAKIGANKVQYNFKNSQGCNDSTLFTMIVADTVGATCKKYDTITVTNNVTKYDTVTVKNNVYDTVTVTNNVTKYDTVIVPKTVTKYDTVKVNTYDTITVTNSVTKYDTVIVKTNVFDTVKVNKYDTITITNNVTKYDTVIVKTNVFDTVKVNTYDTITVTNSVTKYDTVIVNKTKYDTITVTETVSILNIKFKLTTGVQANQLASMSVYPNPTSDVLHIEIDDAKALEGYRYRILDALGKEVYNELVKNTITEIPLKTLGAAGMYQLEVLDANKTSIQTNKIVLQ